MKTNNTSARRDLLKRLAAGGAFSAGGAPCPRSPRSPPLPKLRPPATANHRGGRRLQSHRLCVFVRRTGSRQHARTLS